MPGKKYQLFLKGLQNETRRIEIDEDASIEHLLDKTSELSGIPKDDQRILYCSKELRPLNEHGEAQYLSDYNIQDEGNLFLVLRLLGGSEQPDQEPDVPKAYGPDVQLTDLPDMFTLDDEEGGQRALMPCKHAIGPESLTAYCRSLLTTGKFEFRCPYKAAPTDPFCDQLWEFFIVKQLAVLTKAEIKEFETKIAENYLWKAVGIQECPGCRSFCERQNKKDRRVVCPICTKQKKRSFDFCWYCLKPWLTKDTTNCGNASCTGQDPRIRILKTCPTKVVVGVLNCPDVRACPKCGLLIQHKDACKHMECPCKQRFCFICLKKANEQGRYQCGSYNTKCEVAPRQTTIPGD